MNKAFPSMAASGEQGMDLRDWLAGQAMSGIMASWDSAELLGPEDADDVASTAYMVADAMLEKRKCENLVEAAESWVENRVEV